MTAPTTSNRNRAVIRRHHAGVNPHAIAREFDMSSLGVMRIIGRQELADIGPGKRLTQGAYDALVEGWNGKTPDQRKAAARECASKGHEYRITPFGDDVHVCRRCLKYDRDRSN